MAGYSGDAGDAMMPAHNRDVWANGEMFSTQDRNNVDWEGCPSTLRQSGGWWYGKCTASNLNGVPSYSVWKTVSDDMLASLSVGVQASRMLLKFN